MSAEGEVQPNWRQRLREIGKEAFIREEMERLGFWPPAEGLSERAREAEEQLKVVYVELAGVRKELSTVQSELGDTDSVAAMLSDIRKRRIERVRAARDVKREQKAAAREAHQQEIREWRQKTLPYLGEGVSGGLKYEGGDASKLERLGLPALNTAAEMAAAIEIPERELSWLTYHRGAALVDHYTRFTIPKRKGGLRVISSPKRELRKAQQWLLQTVLALIPTHDAAMAFLPGRSIVDNARIHAGRSLIVRIDLKSFFPSIGFRRVKGLFESFGYNEGVSTIFALLATEAPRLEVTLDGQKRHVAIGARQLPQGACTSPAITNILCRKMDSRLSGAAGHCGFTYTRYADDLVFSHPQGDASLAELFSLVRTIVAAEGFCINEEKTAVLRPQHRQNVTGLVVNDQPRVSREDIRRFRAFLHGCEKHGFPEMTQRLGQDAQAYAAGYLSFIHMVNPEQEARIHRSHPWLLRWQKTS